MSSMTHVSELLSKHGPMRSSQLAHWLEEETGASPDAIRKRLSRLKPPIRTFPFSLLPKREAFFYLEADRGTEKFWTNFYKALQETDSIYGAAIDGLMARGGVIPFGEFAVISGAPAKQLKHVPVELVLERLCDAGFVRQENAGDEATDSTVEIGRHEIGSADFANMKRREIIEGVMLDGLREWVRKNGFASYNSIAIRGDDHPRLVGPYKWDLTGPSYLLPLRKDKPSLDGQGFFVADVFSDILSDTQIRYFIKKTMGLRAILKVGRILPMVFAQGFTSNALTLGHQHGLLLTTPETLFGEHVARSIGNLSETLSNSAAIVSSNPSRLVDLLENLNEIEGTAGNLRGILFELIVAHLVRQNGSIDMGVKACDPRTNKVADIDVLLVKGKSQVVTYECKGKRAGLSVTLLEVEGWLRRLTTFKAHIKSQQRLANASIRFELWTSGGFTQDALDKLIHEKEKRTTNPIDWKDGAQVRSVSQELQETAITKAIDEHFFKHPLAKMRVRQGQE